MKSPSWTFSMVSSCPPLLVVAILVGCAAPPPATPAAWQQWIHDEMKLLREQGPAWQQPGVEAALIQFGYDYRDRRDGERVRGDGVDHQLVVELREDLIRKGVPVNSVDGVAWVDAAAEMARNTLCPEDIPIRFQQRGGRVTWRIVGGVLGALAILLVIWLSVRERRGRPFPSA